MQPPGNETGDKAHGRAHGQKQRQIGEQRGRLQKQHGQQHLRQIMHCMDLSSLKKKFKDKKFAAGCSRDVIRQGAEMLGWDLDKLLGDTIAAMRPDEAAIAEAVERLS